MRRTAAALAIAAFTAVGLLGVQPAAVAAADGFSETGATTYQLDPAKGLVRVTVTLKLTNRTPDGREPYTCLQNTSDPWFGWIPTLTTCYRTTRYFYNSALVQVAKDATSIKATSAGSKLTVTPGAESQLSRPVTVTFPDLYNGQTRTIKVTYVVKGGGPRTATAVRAMRAYSSFCAIANGADSATLSVRVPKGFTFETSGRKMSVRTSGKERIYSSGKIANTTDFWVCFDGTNESGYRTEHLAAAGGRDVTLKSWPEDTAWAKGIRADLASGLAALVKLTGRPMSGTAPLVIKEAITGNEYAGSYDERTSTITVDEDFQQPSLVQHELAHVWFNGSAFSETWLNEGQAEWAGRVASHEAACDRPAGDGSGISLATWQYVSPRATDQERQAVQAEYDAACYVVTRVGGVAGTDRMTAALTALLERRDPYAADPAATRGTKVATWKDWLDAVDELALAPAGAGADLASNLLLEYGATTDRATLARRAEARTAYHALAAAVGDWVVPAAVRNPLAAWDFGTASSAVAAAEAAWTITGETDETLDGVDARHGPAADAWAAARTVKDLDAAAALAESQLEAAKDVAGTAAMVGQPLDFAQQVGLLGARVPSLDPAVAAVRSADTGGATRLAASVRDALAGLRSVGQERIGVVIAVVVTVLALLILLMTWRVQRGSRGRRVAPAGAAPTWGAGAPVSPAPARTPRETPWPPVAVGTAGPSVDDSPTQEWTLPFVAPPPVEPIHMRPPTRPAGPSSPGPLGPGPSGPGQD